MSKRQAPADWDGRPSYGEENGKAKLTEQQVLAMRLERAAGATYQTLADAYGVSATTVWHVVHRRTWQYVA